MPGITVVMLCAILAVLALIRYRSLINPIFVFCLIFALSTWLSTMGIARIDIPSAETFLTIGIGVFCFSMGGFLVGNPFRNIKNKSNNYEFSIDYKKFFIIVVVGTISSIIELKNALMVFLRGGITAVYTERLSAQFDGAYNLMHKNFIESINSQFIFQPIMYFLMPAFLLLYFKTNKPKYSLYSLISLGVIVISNGGRTVILLYIIYFLILYFKLKKRKMGIFGSFKNKIKYFITGSIVLTFLFYTFSQRHTNILSTIGSYYGYPIIHMQYKLIEATQYFYTYGMTSFQGLLRPIVNMIELITGTSFQILNDAGGIAIIANSPFLFNNGLYYNAFVTPFYYFYCDGGMLGVIILSFCFGWFSNKMYLNYIYKDDFRRTLLFLLSFGLPICFAFVRFQYALSTIPWAMVICYLVTQKKKFKQTNDCCKND